MILEQNKYDVFISYTRADYVDENKNVIPGNPISLIKDAFDRAGITYWFDEEGVYAGDTFAPVIARAIHNCDVFLYVSSERSNASEWTSNEIATAYAYKKKIIPFRVDDSQYHESVIIFIAKLDYIDYASNPSRAISRLVSGVTEYLTHQKEMLAEKERKDKEERERLRLEKEKEQAELASEVELSARELNTDEGKAQDKRRRITRDVQKIEDEEIRNQLLELIDQSGPIHLAHKQERARLTSEIETLNEKVGCMYEEIVELNLQLDAHEQKTKRPDGRRWLYRWLLAVIAVIVLIALVVLIIDKNGIIDNLNHQLSEKNDELVQNKATLDIYEKWILKNAVQIIDATVSQSRFPDIPSTIIVNYRMPEDSPVKANIHQGSRLKFDVQARCGEITEESYWEFTRRGDIGRTEVEIYGLLKRLVSQKNVPYEEGSMPIEIVFAYDGNVLYVEELTLTEKQVKFLQSETDGKFKK